MHNKVKSPDQVSAAVYLKKSRILLYIVTTEMSDEALIELRRCAG